MRPPWYRTWLDVAEIVSRRATCDRKHVGAVIVSPENHVVATGYNGSPAGMPHCDDVGHELKEIGGRDSCVRTLHAESNALDQAGKLAKGCVVYTTVYPCYDCAKRIVNSGIWKVVYREFYLSRNTEEVQKLFTSAGVALLAEPDAG